MLGADPESREILDSAGRLAIRLTCETLDLDQERPAVRLAVQAWIGAINEAALGWFLDERPFPVGDLIEMLMATLAEMLRQAARLDPDLDPSSALAALDHADRPGGVS